MSQRIKSTHALFISVEPILWVLQQGHPVCEFASSVDTQTVSLTHGNRESKATPFASSVDTQTVSLTHGNRETYGTW